MQRYLEITFCHVPCKRSLLRELPLPSALLRRQASSSRSASSRASPRQTSPLPPHLPLLPSCEGAAWQRRSCAGGAGRMRTRALVLAERGGCGRRRGGCRLELARGGGRGAWRRRARAAATQWRRRPAQPTAYSPSPCAP